MTLQVARRADGGVRGGLLRLCAGQQADLPERDVYVVWGVGREAGDFYAWTPTPACYTSCILGPHVFDVWFAGKLVWESRPAWWTPPPVEDRVGTNRVNGAR